MANDNQIISQYLDALEFFKYHGIKQPEKDNLLEWIIAYGIKVSSTDAFAVSDLFQKPETITPPWENPPPQVKKITLSVDQTEALHKIQAWIKRNLPNERIFVLKGYAGTGKTFMLEMLRRIASSSDLYFAAPTNKAAKVLSAAVGTKASTIYSLLGIRMKQEEVRLVLKMPDDIPHFASKTILVIDEGSMINSPLTKFIRKIIAKYNIRVLYAGDPAQIPPIGEDDSPVWKEAANSECRATLRQVVRYDNQLLKLATHLRDCIKEGNYRPTVKSDFDDQKGVIVHGSRNEFIESLKQHKSVDDFKMVKVGAWRNKCVNFYNDLIRQNLGFEQRFEVGERLLIGSPIEQDGTIIAFTDEEGVVKSVEKTSTKIEGMRIKYYAVVLKLDDGPLELRVVSRNCTELAGLLSVKAAKARAASGREARHAWYDFWQLKNRFHDVRYAYAMTGHRLQGSTVNTMYVDRQDVFSNPNKAEALSLFYVLDTRPTNFLHTY